MRKKIRGVLIIVLFCITINFQENSHTIANNNEINHRDLTLEYSVHDPIRITNDQNFTDYGFSGNGTEESPFIIENFNITTTSRIGIYIYNTTKHFVVRNCYVDAEEHGIAIFSVDDGTATATNNICINNYYYGIAINSARGSTIFNNTCNYNDNGIYTGDSAYSNILNNTCNYNDVGILWPSFYSIVANNTCNNNDVGISLSQSTGSIVTHNECSNNYDDGISGSAFFNLTINYNTCNNNGFDGIGLGGLSSHYSVINNTCNNNGMYGIWINNEGSHKVINNTCSNNAYEGIILSAWDPSGGSFIANNTLTNCGLTISENYVDAYLSHTVENNWVNGKKLGFFTNLDSEIISDSIYGQLILVNCTLTTISHQILNAATKGLFLYSCSSVTLLNNTCAYNSLYSIKSELCTSLIIINNTCNNNLHGIYLEDTDSCLITYNFLKENENYGVNLRTRTIAKSENNLVHHNIFLDNNLLGTSQASDSGTNNLWYDSVTQEGNEWSDWSGAGSYSIDGSANSVDLYPLGGPVVAEFTQSILLVFLLSIFSLFLVRVLSKKIRKK